MSKVYTVKSIELLKFKNTGKKLVSHLLTSQHFCALKCDHPINSSNHLSFWSYHIIDYIYPLQFYHPSSQASLEFCFIQNFLNVSNISFILHSYNVMFSHSILRFRVMLHSGPKFIPSPLNFIMFPYIWINPKLVQTCFWLNHLNVFHPWWLLSSTPNPFKIRLCNLL